MRMWGVYVHVIVCGVWMGIHIFSVNNQDMASH